MVYNESVIWSSKTVSLFLHMGDCLRTEKPFRYITNHHGQSILSLRGRSAWLVAMVKAGHIHPCQVAGNTV